MKNSFFKLYAFIFALAFISCTNNTKKQPLKTGIWRGEISMQNKIVPFNFEIKKNDSTYTIDLINGGETLDLGTAITRNDSLFFSLHIFDIDIKAKIKDTILEGVYVKNYATNYILPFKATFGKKNRVDTLESSTLFDGKWDVTFIGKNNETSKAIGLFNKKGDMLTGTFLTPTGDYRFLDGFTKNNTFTLYSFDGNHAFIFEATIKNDTLKGDFWSGKTFHEKFIAVRDENVTLPDPNKLTFLKEGYDKIEFSFPDLNKKMVSLTDDKYKNKVVILQIFGTWCPNCMDETKFYTKWYNENKDRGVEIIGLAYEIKDDFDYAKKRVEKMKKQLHVNYDFLIAGTSSNGAAAKTLPMLNHIMSFPTTIIIDKKGKVRKIHTGFSGPATGDYYQKFIDEFNHTIDKLLEEE